MTLILNGTDNSATTPAVTGTDTDTGIYYPASNVVAISTNGAEIARATSTQLLVGTSTGAGSSAKMEVFATSTGPSLFSRAQGDITNQQGQALVLSDSVNTNLRANFIVQQIGSRGGLGIGTTEVGVTNDRDIYLNYTGGIVALGGGTTVNTSGGALQLTNGSRGGITFPATQVASSDANTLDDYEEGTFTPVLNRDSSSPTVTYTDRQGRYTKVGNVVTVSISVVAASVSPAGSGNTTITGLPFANGSTTYTGQGAIGYNTAAVNTLSGSWVASTSVYFRSGTRSDGNDGGGWQTGYYDMSITYLV